MKPAPFDYHRATTVADAVGLIDEYGEDAKVIAGGQSLVPMLAMRLARFDNLIDIARVDELAGITVADDEVRIGATTPHAVVGNDERIARSVPLLTLATPYIGHFQIRNRGTLGGSIAHADPAAEYAAVALALDARMEAVSSRGSREIPAAEFFTGFWENSMAADEILTAVRFPSWGARSGFAVKEFSRRHGDFAIAGAVVGVQLDADNRVSRCAIGLLGLGPTPLRAPAAEQAVIGAAAAGIAVGEIGAMCVAPLDSVSNDLQGSAGYRKKIGATMAARALTKAIAEAEASHA